ncbi:hypothetical protein [Ruminococcus sp.]|nr:hypothetical protein [Ruminococcus sp.]
MDKIECRSYLRKIAAISYEDTQSYQITKMFINDRRQILRHLFEE